MIIIEHPSLPLFGSRLVRQREAVECAAQVLLKLWSMTNAPAPTELSCAPLPQSGRAEASDLVTAQLAAAVELRCGGKARLTDTSQVQLDDPNGRAWAGQVYVFELDDRERTRRAYAWPTKIEAGLASGIHVVLHLPSIMSPTDAVMRVLGARRRSAAETGPSPRSG